MDPLREENYESYMEFICDFSKILFPTDGVFVRNKYLFRGQGSSDYQLRASFDRLFSSLSPIDKIMRYTKFVELLREEFGRLGDGYGDLDQALGLAQHLGIPTRLLDWTSSPLVASYFAFHERVTRPISDQYVSIYAIDACDGSVWNVNNGIEIVKLSSIINSRAGRQLGFVTKLSSPKNCIEDIVYELKPNKVVIWKFNIRADDARAAFAFLDASNIRAAELFGDLEGAARTALERVYLDYSS